MKKIILGACLAAFAAAPALAAKTTVEFKRDSGESVVVTLDGEGGATMADGATTTYTYDAEAMKMCFATPDGDNCATFAERKDAPKVGDSVRYTASDGAEGTATVIAIEE